MKRTEHTFNFPARVIAQAAAAAYEHHIQRAEVWKNGHDLEVDDGKGKHKATKAQAAEKAKEHTEEARVLRAESEAYASQGDTSYPLDPEDIVHFHLAGGEFPTDD